MFTSNRARTFNVFPFVSTGKFRFLTAIKFEEVRSMFGDILGGDGKKVCRGEGAAQLMEHGQRELNVKRAKEIAKYIRDNKRGFVLPPIVISIGCDFDEEISKADFAAGHGKLNIHEGAKLHIIDGQHRTAGVIMALREDPSLALESLPVYIVCNSERQDDRQHFADINATPCKVPLGKNVLFNGRDKHAAWVQNLDSHESKARIEWKKPNAKLPQTHSVPGLYAMAKECKSEQVFHEVFGAMSRTPAQENGIFHSIVVQTALARLLDSYYRKCDYHSDQLVDMLWAKGDFSRDAWEGVCVLNGALSKSAKLVNDTYQKLREMLEDIEEQQRTGAKRVRRV
jgi:DGQHR domain-containing protein